jgi:hypothetical protein
LGSLFASCPGHQLRRSRIVIAAASVGALAAALTLCAYVREPQNVLSFFKAKNPSSPQLDDVSFVQRFPQAFDFEVSASHVELEVQRAKSQLAQAMRSQPVLPADSSLGISAANGKVPLPRVRPSAANLIAVSLPDQASTPSDPLSNVSAALKKVFAMLQPSETVLASASPEGGISGDGKDGAPPTLAETRTALYDISARTVYMPDGTRLEAHSGLGELMDDPTQVHVHDRGATPPQIYELSKREKPFHGVEALRMKPVGQGDLFGRAGLLTHSYLMGPKGDSNGCVSFKDYATFLQAYKAGAVKRLIVVPSLADPTVMVAQKTSM